MKKIKFIDLFSGIGGFHCAVKNVSKKLDIDFECVYSSEIDPYAINVYNNNFNIDSANDIRECDPSDPALEDYQLLLAGFPCQAFSKAGSRMGFEDNTKGTLFFEIKRLLEYRVQNNKPVKYVLLENVSNLGTHDNGNTIKTIKNSLNNLGYILTEDIVHLSPHQFGIPQLRSRVFILCIHKDYVQNEKDLYLGKFLNFDMPKNKINQKNITNYKSILQTSDIAREYYMNDVFVNVLNMWSEFYDIIKSTTPVIGFPIWSEYFRMSESKVNNVLSESAEWKKNFIRKNRKIYVDNKIEIDLWLKRHNNLKNIIPSHRKFEWQAGNDILSLSDGIIQFRPSGIRVKRPSEFPALVAMVQIPIIMDNTGNFRKLTVREVARLQSFPEDFEIDRNQMQAYKQFGNSVNVKVVEYCLEQLFKY